MHCNFPIKKGNLKWLRELKIYPCTSNICQFNKTKIFQMFNFLLYSDAQ